MKMNIIMVYNKNKDSILMCLRSKEPYKGLYNLVGGKVDALESGIDSAYRELFEETAITDKDIKLVHFMNFNYILQDIELEVYVGKLNKEVELVEEVNKLYWIDKDDDFFDIDKFAGEGNIGHINEQVKLYSKIIFDN